MGARAAVDVAGLEAALRNETAGEVRFDRGSRALYATDASNFRQPPIGVVIPRSVDDVVAAHRVCYDFQAPILPRGCGTSLSGESVNYAVVLDCSKYLHRIINVDPARRLARCEPGAINEQVNIDAGRHGLVFAPDPSTHGYCTIGGNIGNNSCGIHSLLARFAGNGSRTSDNVEELEVLTYDGLQLRVGATGEEELARIVAECGRRGEIYRRLRELRDRHADRIRERFSPIPRRVSGYNLDELLPERGFHVARALVGTEGTCVTVLEATLKLVPAPRARSLLVAGYEDIFAVGEHLVEILEHEPMACEAIDQNLFHNMEELHLHPRALSELPEGGAWVLVEFGGDTKADSDDRARTLMDQLGKSSAPPEGMSLFDDPAQEAKLWETRHAGLAATAFSPDGTDHWPGWEDSAVAPEHMAPYLRELRALYQRYGYRGAMYGHLGDGCVHSRISFDLRTTRGVARYRAFMEEAADLVVSFGGSLSGEHGDGQQRAELLPRMFGPELVDAFREFKAIWDPDGKMNPGKVVDPYRLDKDLKLGPDYNPKRSPVRFAYREDGGDFAHAALRCVGVGKCRQPSGMDVMCPSFMVLREEQHTTRGRARLFFEMLQGDVITDGWRSREVYDALNLCLACKGCSNDCPVNVDMPTYKAEFLHHHWKGRLRPRHAYALGLIDQAARMAGTMPRVANLVAQTPAVSRLLKRAAGVTPHRAIPRFAPRSFQRWFHRRDEGRPAGRPVVLWPDTFNNYFHAEVAVAAVEALEAAGWQVIVPGGHVCCGRPLYDFGFLRLAERYLRRSIAAVRPYVRQGIPVVGLEPSCLAVFKDELGKLLPHDDDGCRLAENAYHFAEFFDRFDLEVPRLDRRALVWGHCHHKATGALESEHELLRHMGIEVETVHGGCCGLAGSWGYEAGHYALSMDCGEEGLFPAIRKAAPDVLLVADGFSCRTQIEQGTDRRAQHLAQVMQMARQHSL